MQDWEIRYGRQTDAKISQHQTSPKMRSLTPNVCTTAAAALDITSLTEDHVKIWSTVTRGIIWGVFLSTRVCVEALQCEPLLLFWRQLFVTAIAAPSDRSAVCGRPLTQRVRPRDRGRRCDGRSRAGRRRCDAGAGGGTHRTVSGAREGWG